LVSLSLFFHTTRTATPQHALPGPNEAIIRVGFTGSKMYILAKGRCQIEWVEEDTGDVRIVGEITDGCCFGELAMLFESRRTATVRTLKFCETLFLHRQNYMMVAKHFPQYAKSVRKAAIKVMWSNMLTSHTLKDALVRAAQARDDEKARKEVSVSDLTEQMRGIMSTMASRLLDMENDDLMKRSERKKIEEKEARERKVEMDALMKENERLRQGGVGGEKGGE
jgi:CRP-like cAMP-binding protein